MRKLILGVATFTLLLFSSPAPVLADGMIISPPNFYVDQIGQKAVIWHDGKTETLILSTTFRGDAKDFAWIVPVPTRPEVDKASDELFTALNDLTQPKIYPYPVPLGLEKLETSGGREQITVLETKRVDIYDITVLQAGESKALTDWLEKNGYPYPKTQEHLLKSYIERNWYFVAVKVTTEALGFAGEYLKEGHATPLKFKFASDKIIYPLKISAIGQGSPRPPRGEPMETEWQTFTDSLYKRIWIEKLNWFQAREICASQDAHLVTINNKAEDTFVHSLCGAGYNCYLGHRNPAGYCQKPYANWDDGTPFVYANWAPGEPEFACGEDCLEMKPNGQWNNEWSDNLYGYRRFAICEKSKEKVAKTEAIDKKLSEIIELSTPDESKQVQILLYIFSNHKKTSPGFEIQYAGWVKPKKIEKLAFSEGGEPWIKAEKRMYLTRLVRTMKPVEMTEDLILRDADDNKPVGGAVSFLDVVPFRLIAVLALPLLVELLIIGYIWYRRRKVY